MGTDGSSFHSQAGHKGSLGRRKSRSRGCALAHSWVHVRRSGPCMGASWVVVLHRNGVGSCVVPIGCHNRRANWAVVSHPCRTGPVKFTVARKSSQSMAVVSHPCRTGPVNFTVARKSSQSMAVGNPAPRTIAQ